MDDALRRFYERREKRLSLRLERESDPVLCYRLRRAIRRNAQKIAVFDLTAGKSKVMMNESKPSVDGGPGSGNFGHEGVPGQVGGSAPSGVTGVTKFKRSGGKMSVTSDITLKSDGVPATLKAGTTISKIVDFAGSKKKRPVAVEPHLVKQYGGKAGSWTHTRGEAKVVLQDGREKTAEIHWFESKDVGQVGMKVKRYLEEDGDES